MGYLAAVRRTTKAAPGRVNAPSRMPAPITAEAEPSDARPRKERMEEAAIDLIAVLHRYLDETEINAIQPELGALEAALTSKSRAVLAAALA